MSEGEREARRKETKLKRVMMGKDKTMKNRQLERGSGNCERTVALLSDVATLRIFRT